MTELATPQPLAPGAPVTIETVADYWNRRPCNIRHSTAPIGTRDYFDDVETRKYFVEPHIPGFADFARWKGRSVIEIGCGIGTDAVNFARNGARYTGVELSQVSLDLAKKRFGVFGLDAAWAQCNAEELSRHVAHRSFDLVYSFGVIHHTPNPARVMAEARKVIADDGEFRLMLYARNSWKDVMIDAGYDQPEAQTGCPIAFTYTHQEVTQLLDATGFRVVSIEQEHIFPYVIEKYVRYEYELQPWFAAMPRDMFRALERRLGWHLLITAKPA